MLDYFSGEYDIVSSFPVYRKDVANKIFQSPSFVFHFHIQK